MTAEKRYAAALYMLQAWEQAAFNSDDLTRAVEKEPQKWQYAKAFPVAAAAAEIMIDALESMDSKRSSKRSLTAAKNIISNCLRQDLQGVFEDGGKYCVCDGFRAIRYNADMESLPRAAGRIDLDKIMRDAERAELLELPTAAKREPRSSLILSPVLSPSTRGICWICSRAWTTAGCMYRPTITALFIARGTTATAYYFRSAWRLISRRRQRSQQHGRPGDGPPMLHKGLTGTGNT